MLSWKRNDESEEEARKDETLEELSVELFNVALEDDRPTRIANLEPEERIFCSPSISFVPSMKQRSVQPSGLSLRVTEWEMILVRLGDIL